MIRSFSVTVTDGVLNLEFSDAGGSDYNWIVNGLKVVPTPGAALLLGTGLMGLALLGWRRKWL